MLGFLTTLVKSLLDTTDRMAVRTVVVVRRNNVATSVEVQGVRVVTEWRCRPIVAVGADIVQTASEVVPTTRSRVPNGRCRTELAGEIHAFIATVVGVVKT